MDGKSKAKFMQKVTDRIWEIIKNNFDDIVSYDPAMYVYKTEGRIGNSRGNKNKPMRGGYSSHFLKQLDAPDIVKSLSSAFDELKERDEELYTYIYLRANEYSHREIDMLELPEIDGKFTKKTHRPSRGWVVGRTSKTKKMTEKARRFFIDNLPEELSNNYIDVPFVKRRSELLVDCPLCASGCKTCNRTAKIPAWLAKKIQERINSGGEWAP